MEEHIGTLREESKVLRREIRQKTLGYITAGFGFVAGLAWNEAIRSLIEYLFPLSQNSVLAKFAYAFVMTVAVVVATLFLMRFSESASAQK